MTSLLHSRRTTKSAVAAVLLAATAFVFPVSNSARDCPGGYHRADSPLRKLAGLGNAEISDGPGVCVNDKHPESIEELEAMAAQRMAIRTSPDGVIPAGAIAAALDQRRAITRQGQAPQNAHRWTPLGTGALKAAEPGYASVNTLGLDDLMGRITSFAYAPPTDRRFPDTLFASFAYGGIWITDSNITRWVSIGDNLPTQIVGAVGYSPYGKGIIIALTGDGSFGRYSREGAGAYFSADGGKHWTRARGIPDEAFGFKIAVDKANPRIVYAATGSGLFKSTNGGRAFTNVKLPTGECAGKSNRVKPCLLANVVTDVVVMAPGGVTEEKTGKVLAAVGWNGGNRKNPDGTVQSPNNGLYASDTGDLGTFSKLAMTGFPSQERIGRIELGEATGPDQDHNIVYAMVQDAVLVRKGLPGIDAPGFDYNETCLDTKETLADAGVPALPFGLPPCEMPTSFNGAYVSLDWGQTWTLMTPAAQLMVPGTGSALTPGFMVLGNYAPGVQSWYNEFIKPDPTTADPVTGAPTRVIFGLEEVWESVTTDVPLIGPAAFRVIGRYYSGPSCIAVVLSSAPACPTDGADALTDTPTTHPDQHDAVFIPTAGGVRLVVGNDGGVYSQVAPAGADFSNTYWGNGANTGFNTLLPYDAVRANDGTVWMGLQDNGTAKIVDVRRGGRVVQRGRTIMARGGDGLFVAVDPNNSKVAYGETPYAAMFATTDGGITWTDLNPPVTDTFFNNPFVMDPKDPNHLMTAGRQIVETGSGPGTSSEDWEKVFDLGTAANRGSASAKPTPTDPANQMTAVDLVGPNAYVGFCGTCDVLNVNAPFRNGIATNVGGSKRPASFKSDGWHFARAFGLPNRYITAIAIDRQNPKTVYVSLGGYLRKWTPPGSLDRARVTGGHIYVSHDAGDHFTNVSGNLPNTPVNWITLRGKQVIAATDIGVYVSQEGRDCDRSCSFQVLGKGLPQAPVFTARLTADDPNFLIASTFGRGVWGYRFGPKPAKATVKAKPLPAPAFLNKPLGSFDFEVGDQGWTTRTSNDLAAWRRTPPGSASSSAFQLTPYADESTASLISPPLSVPARSLVKVQWDERRDTEPCCDFMSLEWSTTGRLWSPIRSIDGQNPDFPSFTTVTGEFVAPAGTLYLRFRLSSDQLISSPPYTGVAIDNVIVKR